MNKLKTTKPQKGLDEWIQNQLRIGNPIRNITNFLIFPALIFWLVGQFYNGLVIVFQGFLICYFLVMPLMMINDAIVESQNAFLDARWAIKKSETANENTQRPTIWRRITPSLLLFGAIPAAFSYLAFWIYSWATDSNTISLDPWPLLFLAAIIALIPTWVITHLWIKRYFARDLSAFATAMSQPKPAKPEPFSRYFFGEHALSWVIILVILNLIINLKGFTENLHVDGVIAVSDLTFSVWITTFVLLLWMTVSAMNQVRADVHLGRVKEGKPLSTWLVVLLILGIPILAGGMLYFIGILLTITTFSVTFSTGLILIVAGGAGALGRYFGIWWGKTREFKRIASKGTT